MMANAAEKNADFIVITNDNPRTEDAKKIADDILRGFSKSFEQKVTVILNRETAVRETLSAAKPNDMVLLAGKGHENYIIVPKYDDCGKLIGTEKLPYDERAIVKKFYANSRSNILDKIGKKGVNYD